MKAGPNIKTVPNTSKCLNLAKIFIFKLVSFSFTFNTCDRPILKKNSVHEGNSDHEWYFVSFTVRYTKQILQCSYARQKENIEKIEDSLQIDAGSP